MSAASSFSFEESNICCLVKGLTPYNQRFHCRLWVAQSDGGDYNFTYKIGVCSALQPNGADEHACHSGTAICMDFNNGTVLSAGNTSVISIVENKEHGDVWYFTAGDACPEDPSNNLTTSINFKCGPLIVSFRIQHNPLPGYERILLLFKLRVFVGLKMKYG